MVVYRYRLCEARIVKMGMRDNWEQFVEVSRLKSKSHLKASQYWNTVNTILSLALIFFGAVTSFLAMVNGVPNNVVSGIAAVGTFLSAVSAFLKAPDRRQLQLQYSQEFQTLMMRMVRCEADEEYEAIWQDYNKVINGAPFLPKKFEVDREFTWNITPELDVVVKAKEGESDDEEEEEEIVHRHNDSAERIPLTFSAKSSARSAGPSQRSGRSGIIGAATTAAFEEYNENVQLLTTSGAANKSYEAFT